MLISKARFKSFILITSIAVYLLILVGGIVRNTGSGMGCPDWPKCFGQTIPPTSSEHLPEDYQTFYLEKRLAKTERLVKTLSSFGLDKVAMKISDNPYLGLEDEFDVKTAWIEYLNRLLGVIIGFLVIASTIMSLSYWKDQKVITGVAVFGFVLILFQGWFGSLVVATNLIPAFVSVHMGLAFLQIAVLMYLVRKTRSSDLSDNLLLRRWSMILLVLMVPQIILGTQVRHIVDFAVFEGLTKDAWLSSIDWTFYVHRSFSILILLCSLYVAYKATNTWQVNALDKKIIYTVASLVILEAIGGAMMYYLDFPLGIQPLHLLAASVLFGLLFYLSINPSKAQK